MRQRDRQTDRQTEIEKQTQTQTHRHTDTQSLYPQAMFCNFMTYFYYLRMRVLKYPLKCAPASSHANLYGYCKI